MCAVCGWGGKETETERVWERIVCHNYEVWQVLGAAGWASQLETRITSAQFQTNDQKTQDPRRANSLPWPYRNNNTAFQLEVRAGGSNFLSLGERNNQFSSSIWIFHCLNEAHIKESNPLSPFIKLKVNFTLTHTDVPRTTCLNRYLGSSWLFMLTHKIHEINPCSS